MLPTHKALLILACVVETAVSPQVLADYAYGEPSAYEQFLLEKINFTRTYPQKIAEQLQVKLLDNSRNGVQPLSFNAQLLADAESHSEEMLKQNYLSYINLRGENFTDRLKRIGYPYADATEAISKADSTLSLDKVQTIQNFNNDLFSSVETRENALLNPRFREVGLGLAFGNSEQQGNRFASALFCADFGVRSKNNPIILGVVYADNNHNQLYDIDEGRTDININVGFETSTRTAKAGGYGVEVEANKQYTLTFSHPDYGSVVKSVQVGDANVKIDVLMSEFSKATPQHCANFADGTLYLPCVEFNRQKLKAKLNIINVNPLQLQLQYLSQEGINPLAQCENFDTNSQSLDLNCVAIGTQNYSGKILLNTSHPGIPVFDVQSIRVKQ